MHRLVMQLSVAVGSLIFSIAANAALVSYSVTGSWDGMQTWNPGQSGDNTLSTTTNGGPEMSLTGVVTFDDVTGAVSYVELEQVGTLTSNWDLNPDYPNTPEYDTVTMDSFHWKSSSATDLRLLAGNVTCNGVNNAACGPGMQYGGNYIGRGGPLETFGPPYSLTDWTGADNKTAYGDIIDGPGFAGTVDTGNLMNPFAINTVTYVNPFVALAATGEYNLSLGSQLPTVVPVPAAVWLFGSALGLLGLRRRR